MHQRLENNVQCTQANQLFQGFQYCFFKITNLIFVSRQFLGMTYIVTTVYPFMSI